MARILGVALLIGLTTSAALADVLITKKGKTLKVHGLPDEVEGATITAENCRIYLAQSEGVVVEENYDEIVWKKNDKTKRTETFPRDEIAEILLSPTQVHPALDQGDGAFARGNLAGAIAAYQECVADEAARPVDRNQASFNIGLAYAKFGRTPAAEKHFANWNGGKSVHTPDALRILAEIQTVGQKYADARKTYERIKNLPAIPESWKLRADAGMVKVDIAERKFAEAERAAAAIARAAGSDEARVGARALAMGLQAQAIKAAQDAARLPEAEKLLREALALQGLDNTNLAYLNSELGDILYAQKNAEEARFPYMRVVELYPEETGYVANCLLNAGNCFIDLAMKAQNAGNEKVYCDYMVKGMLLISECGLKYRGSAAARDAGGVWKRNRAAYEACKKKMAADSGAPAGNGVPADEPTKDDTEQKDDGDE